MRIFKKFGALAVAALASGASAVSVVHDIVTAHTIVTTVFVSYDTEITTVGTSPTTNTAVTTVTSMTLSTTTSTKAIYSDEPDQNGMVMEYGDSWTSLDSWHASTTYMPAITSSSTTNFDVDPSALPEMTQYSTSLSTTTLIEPCDTTGMCTLPVTAAGICSFAPSGYIECDGDMSPQTTGLVLPVTATISPIVFQSVYTDVMTVESTPGLKGRDYRQRPTVHNNIDVLPDVDKRGEASAGLARTTEDSKEGMKRWVSVFRSTTVFVKSEEMPDVTVTDLDFPTEYTTLTTGFTSSSSPSIVSTTVTITEPRQVVTKVVVTNPSGAAQVTYLKASFNGTLSGYATFTDPSGYTWPRLRNSTAFGTGTAYSSYNSTLSLLGPPTTTFTSVQPASASTFYVKGTESSSGATEIAGQTFGAVTTKNLNSNAATLAVEVDGFWQLVGMSAGMGVCLVLALML